MKTHRVPHAPFSLLVAVVAAVMSGLCSCHKPTEPQPELKKDFVNPPRVATPMPMPFLPDSLPFLPDSLGGTPCTCMPRPKAMSQ